MFRILPLMFWVCLCAPFAASDAWAAAKQPSVFLDVQVAAPETGFAPLTLSFSADEQACRKAYGKDWQRECLPQPGASGQKAEDVHLSPPHPGEWRWEDESRLRFVPEKVWPPNTAFQIQLSGNALAAHIGLRASKLSMRTPPEAASFSGHQIFVDPGPAAKHVLTHTARFLYPADANTTRGIRVEAVDPAAGLRLAAPEFIWNHNATELIINTRVLELSEEPTRVRAVISGLPLFLTEERRIKIHPQKPVESVHIVGGKKGLLRIGDLKVAVVQNERLQREYHLNLTSNLQLDPERIAKLIRVVQLPRTRGPEAKDAFAWNRAPVIDAEDLARGGRVELKNAGESNAPSGKLSFRLPVEAGSYIHVALPADLASVSGLQLGRESRAVLRIQSMSPELHFLQSGNILPLEGEKKLGLYASGLDGIRWEVTQMPPGMLAWLVENSAAFSYASHFRHTSGPVARGELKLANKEPGAAQFTVLDLAPLLKTAQGEPTRGILLVGLKGVVDGKEQTDAHRFVLATDLGLVIKKAADGSRDVFVASLSKGQPVTGATVEVIGRNGLPVMAVQSDAAGRARLPSLKGLDREKEPVAVTARLNSDLAFLPLNDSGRLADHGGFAAGGQRGGNGLNAYVF
ncbi:MAG: hypothetical protein LBH94_07500, partial [Deltaproteobacteria bacterium]|nr:hypothetical protein [Deltaproteobacteria bacterium]